MTQHRHMLRAGERGFTIVEVLVAALILVVGVTGTLTMVNTANEQSVVDQGREAGTNLARDLIEAAGNVSYDQLAAGTITSALQAEPGLGSAGGSWTIVRRGVTYTVTSTACTVDDRVDGFGTAQKKASGFCSDSQQADSTGKPDLNPDDMRRVSVTLQWTQKGETRSLTQAGVVANPGNAAGPQVTNIAYDIAPAALTTTSTVTFTATSTSTATHVKFLVDGVLKADVKTSSGGGTWTYAWPTSGLGDASYIISAQAYDAEERSRGAYVITYKIDRNPAAPPSGFAGGRNLRLFVPNTSNSFVDLDWIQATDPDVFGYRVYRGTSTSNAVQVCQTTRDTANDPTECTDTNPPSSSPVYYGVVSLDKDPAGNVRESKYTAVGIYTDTDRPSAPSTVTASYTPEGNVTLTWTAANPGKKGEPIAFYRIYRDGVALADRFGRTGGTELTWTAPSPTGATTHTYRVGAVDTLYGESNPGPSAGIVK